VKNLFVVPVENISICTQDDRASKRFWGQYVFETNTICDVWLQVLDSMGVGRISSREGPLLDCYKIFSRGGAKVVKFVFFYKKLRKQPFWWNFQNPGGAEALPCPTFWRPCLIVIQMLQSSQKVASLPQHIFMWIWILYPSARKNKKSKVTRLCRRS